ncbi:hypothetical protein XM38_026870 [Halomicronema hongdechloris C2206]|uniref:Uncharacterized protein n=1 Tax=Halomicronema hongdechloris C2206 TaxID=1641165 RepID=A0A1Z3HN39_9CYAN|nr:hypothetical protein [Halomicronema hongdechloris]ASC71733.1 hypothetical protein XM38_026870 [Halomicronema hongdechloris C2206]
MAGETGDMVVLVVVGLNLAIATAGFYLAWRLWRLRLHLSRLADLLLAWQQDSQRHLRETPLHLGRQGTARLRQQYAQLQQQVLLIRRLVSIMGWLAAILRRRQRLGRSS